MSLSNTNLVCFLIYFLAISSTDKTSTNVSKVVLANSFNENAEEFLIYRNVLEGLGYCLIARDKAGRVALILDKLCLKGNSGTRWIHLKGNLFQNVRFKQCLSTSIRQDGLVSGDLYLQPCDPQNQFQKWKCDSTCHVSLDAALLKSKYNLDHEDSSQGTSAVATPIVRLGFNFAVAKWLIYNDESSTEPRCICDATPVSQGLKTKIITTGGKVVGKPCIFPFIFNGRDQWQCIPVSHSSHSLYCATVRNLDRHRNDWGICPARKRGTFSEWLPPALCDKPCGGGNIFRRRKCLYPPCHGSLLGQMAGSCNNQPCSGDRILTVGGHSSDFPVDGLYSHVHLGPIGLCRFPFIVDRRQSDTCILDHRRNQPWCSLTDNFDLHQKWGHCVIETKGIWSSWEQSDQQRCSKTCGGGHLIQRRKCHYPPCLGSSEVTGDSCNTHPCPDCYTGVGHEYRGTKNTANDGSTCKYWKVLKASLFSQKRHPELIENYCRNPGKIGRHPFCFRDKSDSPQKMYCDLIPCNYKISDVGIPYTIPLGFFDLNPNLVYPCTFPYLYKGVYYDSCLLLNERASGREKCYITERANQTKARYCPSYFRGRWSPWEYLGDCTKSCGSGRRIIFRRCLLGPCIGTGVRVEQTKPCNTHACPREQAGVKNCFTGRGLMYEGTVSTTVFGTTCLRWSDYPILSNSILPDGYPRLIDNHCRNPMPHTYGAPWCYEPKGAFSYCNVPRCPTKEGEIFAVTFTKDIGNNFQKPCIFPFLGADNKLHRKCIHTDYESTVKYCGFVVPADYKFKLAKIIDPLRHESEKQRSQVRSGLKQRISRGFLYGLFGVCPSATVGTWSSWSENEICSVACGGGVLVRIRFCRYPPCSDGKRVKNVDKSKSCNTQKCPDCMVSRGEWYRGRVNRGYKGETCMQWTRVNHNLVEFHPERYPELVKNFCRNPGGKFPSPWCFKKVSKANTYVRIVCDVPHCSDDAVETVPYTLADVNDYSAYNLSGKACAFPYILKGQWYSSCFNFDKTQDNAFCALVEAPGLRKKAYGICPPHYKGVWSTWKFTGSCFTPCGPSLKMFTRECLYPPCKGKRFKFDGECVQRPCRMSLTRNCFIRDGRSYTGAIRETLSGKSCLTWSDASVHHRYHDIGADLDEDYCRNPSPESTRIAPWCYTSATEWDYCNIKKCTFYEGEINTIGGPSGGRPCIFPFVHQGKTYETCIPGSKPLVYSGKSNQNKAIHFCVTQPSGGSSAANWGVCPPIYVGTLSTWAMQRPHFCSRHCGGGEVYYTRRCRFEPCKNDTAYAMRMDKCNTHECHDECFTGRGSWYKGTVSWKEGRKKCGKWKDFNFRKFLVHDRMFALDHNYCRNISPLEYFLPFCMISENKIAVCDVPPCTPYYNEVRTVGLGTHGDRCAFPFYFQGDKHESCFAFFRGFIQKFCRTTRGRPSESDSRLLKTCSKFAEGTWSAWTSTNRCSQPCGGGLMYHTRICRYHPCQGSNGKHEDPCNTFACDKTSNCYDARSKGVEFRGSSPEYTLGASCVIRQGSACLTDLNQLQSLARPYCLLSKLSTKKWFCRVRHCPGSADGPVMVQPVENYEGRPFSPCIFPFRWHSKAFYSCIPERVHSPPRVPDVREKESKFWCATIASLNNDLNEWGYCLKSDRGKWGQWSFYGRECTGACLLFEKRHCLLPPCVGETWRFLHKRCPHPKCPRYTWSPWTEWTECLKCSRSKMRYRYCRETQTSTIISGSRAVEHCTGDAVAVSPCRKSIEFDLQCDHLFVYGQTEKKVVLRLTQIYSSHKYLGSATHSVHNQRVVLIIFSHVTILFLLLI